MPKGNGRRILIKLPNYVGDVITSLPALETIRCGFPRSEGNEIHWLTDDNLVDLLHGQNLFDKAIAPAWDPHNVTASRIALCLKESGPYDISVSFTRQIRFLRGFRKAGIPIRAASAGFPQSIWLTIELSASESSDIVPSYGQRFLLLAQEVVEKLGSKSFGEAPKVRLFVTPESEAEVEAMLGKPDRFYTLVVGSAATKYGMLKRWPVQNFVTLAKRLYYEKPDLAPVFLFGQSEMELYHLCNRFLKECPENLREKLIMIKPGSVRLRHVMALIKGSEFLVSNDTGPRHIAVALKTKVVLILGPLNLQTVTYSSDLEHPVWVNVGCNQQECKVGKCREHHICMTAMTPGLVLKAVLRFVYNVGKEE